MKGCSVLQNILLKSQYIIIFQERTQSMEIEKFQSGTTIFESLILSYVKTIHHFNLILSCLFSRLQNLVDIIFFYYQNKIRTQ